MKFTEVVAERTVGADGTRVLSVLEEVDTVPYRGRFWKPLTFSSPSPCRVFALGARSVKHPAPHTLGAALHPGLSVELCLPLSSSFHTLSQDP